MKISINKFFICCLIMTLWTNGHCFAQDKTTFPESWDKKRNLRGNSEEVLAWTHKTDTSRNFTYKTCITFVMIEDSLGNQKYYLEEEYSTDEQFNYWNTASIHYGPKPGEMIGFYDLHLELFKTKPTLEEITTLLDRWMYHLNEEGWVTIESGIDEALWMKYFGFVWQDEAVKTD